MHADDGRKRRNCAFVNFTNISNAIKAIEGIKNKPDYANLRIAHGKDRCANPPRSGPQGGAGGMRRSASGNTASVSSPLPSGDAANGTGATVTGVDFELDVEDAGFGDADAAVGNAEMLVKDETN